MARLRSAFAASGTGLRLVRFAAGENEVNVGLERDVLQLGASLASAGSRAIFLMALKPRGLHVQ
jgi:hypothetical protein